MFATIRRREALRGWPIWLVIGVNVAAVAFGLAALSARRDGRLLGPGDLLLGAWVASAVYLLFGRARTRAGRLELTLPLAARRLWSDHVVATVAGGAVIGALSVLVGALQLVLLRGPGAAISSVGTIVAHVAAGLALAVVLLQLPDRGLARVRFTRGYALWAAAVLGGVPLVLTGLLPLGPAGALIPLAAALALGYAVRRSLPEGFTMLPREAAAAVDAAAGAAAAPGASRWVVARALLLGVSAGSKEWMGYPFTFLFALISGGVLTVFSDAGELRYMYIPLSAYMMLSVVGPRLGRLHHLDALPVPRRLLFAVLVLPYLATFCAGYGAGALIASRAAARTAAVDYAKSEAGHVVVTPLREREIAWDGRPPAVTAPWGEARVPDGTPLWRGSRAALYSPYRGTRGASPEFAAWQISRAVKATYGAELPAGEILARYFAPGPDGTPAPGAARLPLRRDFPGWRERGGGPMFPAFLILVCVPWLLLTAGLLRTYRAGVPGWARYVAAYGPAGVAILCLFGALGAVMAGWMRPWLLAALVEIPVRKLGGSPAATLALWGAAIALVAAAYAVGRRQFERMEIPARGCKYTLVDWMREES